MRRVDSHLRDQRASINDAVNLQYVVIQRLGKQRWKSMRTTSLSLKTQMKKKEKKTKTWAPKTSKIQLQVKGRYRATLIAEKCCVDNTAYKNTPAVGMFSFPL